MGFIDKGINFLSSLAKGGKEFVQSAVKNTPDYISNNGINKMFYKELNSGQDDIIKKYGSDFIKEIDGKEIIPQFDDLSKTQRGEILNNYRKEMSSKVRDTNAFNALDYEKFDPGSQKHLDSIYRTMNSEGFSDRYMQHQIELGNSGMFGGKYNNFDFSDSGKNLTNAQRETLQKEFNKQYSDKTYAFENLYTPMGPSDIGPSQRLNYNQGLQKRYLETKQGSQQLDMITGFSNSNKKNKSETIIESAIRKNEEGRTAYEGYQSYLKKSIIDTPELNNTKRWSVPDSFETWAGKEGYSTEEIKNLSKHIASGNPDHSGINIWEKAKRHPVIATSIVMGTAFGVSELTENDSF